MSKQAELKINKKAMRLVVFGILMENNGSITRKSTGHILEKFDEVMSLPFDLVANLLDPLNKEKLGHWLEQEGNI